MASGGTHAKCQELCWEALETLQITKTGAVSSAVRKLQVCAHLLDDKKLKKWCSFQLGEFVYKLPTESGELNDNYVNEVISKLKELGIPFSIEEVAPRLGNSGGGFESIEFIEEVLDQLTKGKKGNDGTYYRTNLLKTISSCRNAVSQRAAQLYASFAFGDIPSRQFETIREKVDNLLLELCPEAVEKFMSAYNGLNSKSSEDWSLALTSCRRVIKAVADSLFPPTDKQKNGRKLGEEQYINRLWAFLDEQLEAGSDKDLAKAHVDYLGSFLQRLNDKASKGVHAAVSHEEAVRVVLYTYLTLGDILELTPTTLANALHETGKVDLNSASLGQLRNVQGINDNIAKEILKKRTKSKFTSTDQLLEIKGVGKRTLEKTQSFLTVI